MMSEKLETIMNEAVKKANFLKHEYLTLENVLLALLKDKESIVVLEKCEINIIELRKELEDFLKQNDHFSILSDDQVEELGKTQFIDEDVRKLANENGIYYQPEISLSLQRVIQRAAIHVQSAGKRHISGINLLVAIFQEKESFATYVLQKRGVERFDIIKIISHGLDEEDLSEDDELLSEDEFEGEEDESASKKDKKQSVLEKYAKNLNIAAINGEIDPLIGRENEISRILQILLRRKKNNPLLIGEAGVGKTALVEGLALKIVNNKVPSSLANTEILTLDLSAMIAGTKFRGEFEDRLKKVIKEVEKRNSTDHHIVLFLDEVHTIIGAGSTSGSSMDASNLLKPALASGKLKIIGSTTYEEFRKSIEKDQAFNRRFQKIDVEEPSIDETFKIVKGLKDQFEKHHQVKFSNKVLRNAVNLSSRFITDRRNPDKSIDLIDETGAYLQLFYPNRKIVTNKDVEKTISKIANIPEINIESSDVDKFKNLSSKLKFTIFGQDEAIESVSDAVILSKSGLRDPEKPIASFMFAGPTGVGKTELAKQLAFNLGVELIRFDMSEYMEKHAISKLIGAPPGYIGHDEGGGLTDTIKKNPACIILFDEIEKAHPDIFNVLLQVMDYGKLKDSQGRESDFRNAILVFTTNAGAIEQDKGNIGFQGSDEVVNNSKMDDAIKRIFSPEFRNRLNKIISFNSLTKVLVLKVVDKFLIKLEEKLNEKQISLIYDEQVKEFIAENSYNQKLGARPIDRYIEQHITKHLSSEILFGKLQNGGEVSLKIAPINKKLEISFN